LSADVGLAAAAVLSVAMLALPGRNAVKALALLIAVPLFIPKQLPIAEPSLNTTVTVLDVGQGTSIVVRSGQRVLVYDTGGGDPHGVNMGTLAVLPYLQHRGVTGLDTLIVSHPDLDHSAGSAVIRDALTVERFRFGGMETAPREGRIAGRPCVAGEAWRWPGGQIFQFLSPALELPRKRNDSSCVLQIQVGAYRLLMPGDIETSRERMLAQFWGEQLQSDWLAAGHHGSKTSTSTTFLKWVKPQVVVISSGYANRFRHPHPSVIERLERQGVPIYYTATAGALEFELGQGQTLHIEAHREYVRRYWM
jgi:competence protein ComEC